ncbi:hypothetical protein MHZ90_14350 [Pantoea sp. ACRSH]|uniref:hypothetical protein n=1 Tax=unclassified Pantoea TaxID=2630326 RepID=UPI001EF423B1|nr:MULTISPECIES: hypothetical protein [unclassified Pantoea]MCG7367302.1 hypothetical protein [Pantoea sp. ACRSH]MCG7397595.1 hypothetical protein [Pantoea sp. ACRSC]
MLEVNELLKLMESQQQESTSVTIDQHTQHTDRLSELETELVTVNRKLTTTRKNIGHYQQLAAQMLRTNPERFGPEVVKLLENIITAKVMHDHPELFAELHQLEQRAEEISKEVGK